MSIYIIGDAQGCYQELRALVDEIQFDPSKDQLWFVGDLVNRGPDSLSVLRFVKSLGDSQVTVLGNHDLHLLAASCHAAHRRKNDNFDEILKAPDSDELLAWLRYRPLLHYDESLHVLMVHAGIAPQWDLTTAQTYAKEVETVLQSDSYEDFFKEMYGNEPTLWSNDLVGIDRLRYIVNAFTRMRFCSKAGALEFKHSGPPGSQAKDLVPWFDLCSPANYRIFFGHWAALDGKTGRDDIIGLDTGCVWGKALSAFSIDKCEFFRVKSTT